MQPVSWKAMQKYGHQNKFAHYTLSPRGFQDHSSAVFGSEVTHLSTFHTFFTATNHRHKFTWG